MTQQINEPVDTIEIEYDVWKVYRINDQHYEYWLRPFSIAAELAQKITIKYDAEKEWYNFEAEKYAEVYGSGGWSRWVNYSNEIKDTFLNDAIERIIK